MNHGGDPRLKWWAILLLAACGMLFLAFFMPWWGITVTAPAPPSRPKDNQAMGDYQKDLADWQESMTKAAKHLDKHERKQRSLLGDEYWREKQKEFREKVQEQTREAAKGESAKSVSITARVWGFNWVGVAVTGLVFSIVLLPVAIVPMFVRLLRSWIWIGYFVAAVCGLVLFILSLVWYFSSPGANLARHVAQGVGWYPGPYLEILGSLTTLVTGILGGVFGLLSFLKELKGPGEKPRPKRAPRPETEFIEDDEF